MLVGLTGKAGSGKDTVADILVTHHNFRRIAFADVLKSVAEDIDPFIPYSTTIIVRLTQLLDWYKDTEDPWFYAKQHAEVRRFIQRLGVAIREKDPDFWINRSGIYTYRTTTDLDRVVVTDVRFMNEWTALLDLGGVCFRVKRDNAEMKENSNHVSETSLDGFVMAEINNNGTVEELRAEVERVVLCGK